MADRPSSGSSAAANPDSTRVVAMNPPSQMQRPGLGRSGRPVRLLCNHFAVNYQPSKDVFHYDVSISITGLEPGHDVNLNKSLSRTILEKARQIYGSKEFGGKLFAYDGEKSLFTSGPLPFQMSEFVVLLEESAIRNAGPSTSEEDPQKRRKIVKRGREFKVKVEYVATVKMGSILTLLRSQGSEKAQSALQVLDIVMRQHAAAKDYLLIKDNFFSDKFGVLDIGEGVQTWQGFHVSFRPSIEGLSLNFDIATTTVLKSSSVLDFVRERFNTPNLERVDWDKVKRVLKGIRVETLPTKMVHKVAGFSNHPCSEQKFMRKTKDDMGNLIETELTIQKYYELQYQIFLQHPRLPCIQAGRPKKPVFIPVELCRIVKGQRYTKTLSTNQRQRMIEQARMEPQQRRSIIQQAMKTSEYKGDALIRDFGIDIAPAMRIVPGRVLDAPALKFGNTEEVPQDGKWNLNGKRMETGAKIRSWIVLNFDGTLPSFNADRIAQDLAKVCNIKGMDVPPHLFTLQEPHDFQRLPAADRVQNMVAEVRRRSKSSAPNFMLCILPVKKTSDLYGPLKKLLETQYAIMTQCIAPPKQVKDQYLTNVALKLNAKLGGHNSLLAHEFYGRLPKVSRTPTIIFGMDVSHGSPGFSDSPSIAAVVGSREWPNFSKYGVRLRAQSQKVEMISGLYEESGGMIVELLRDFYHTCRKIPGVSDPSPKQVIIFRDGVSESQFEQVLRDEYLAFKKAFAHVSPKEEYDPKITFIVVQKRHHTRFFPIDDREKRNVAPGTVVDDSLCHPYTYDFYLCAHKGLIGTSRPTHYHVLVDENNFTVDELQQLTHYLCYTYARSTTSVSTVAPVAYAHLAAMHARNFLDSEGSETSSVTMRSEQSTHFQFPELSDSMKGKMFFC